MSWYKTTTEIDKHDRCKLKSDKVVGSIKIFSIGHGVPL